MKVRVNVQSVPIDSVKPNPWNPNRQSDFIFEKELKSIEDHGFVDPILVRETEHGLEIIDGEHRWKAAKAKGATEIPINNLGVVADVDAKQLTIVMNEIRGKADSGLLADLLKSLQGEVSLEKLEASMPFSKIEMDSLLNSASIAFDSLSPTSLTSSSEAVPPPTSGDPFKTITYSLPEAVADQFEDQVLRFKTALNPDDRPGDISPVQAIEAITQHLAQIPDDQLV